VDPEDVGSVVLRNLKSRMVMKFSVSIEGGESLIQRIKYQFPRNYTLLQGVIYEDGYLTMIYQLWCPVVRLEDPTVLRIISNSSWFR
jgi:hypothetical protein